MRPRSNKLGRICLGVAALLSAPNAWASFIDTDFHCVQYGCVVVHDGSSFWVWDNFIFDTGGTVAPGDRMIPRVGNPIQGSGLPTPIITGTLTDGTLTVPLQDQGVALGIDSDGDGVPDLLPNDVNGSGFLDAGDSLDPFALTLNTSLVAADTSAQRSFYLTSRTDFFLAMSTDLRGSRDDLNRRRNLRSISFNYDVTRNGVDGGLAFGADARQGNNYIRPLGTVDDLRDVFRNETIIMEFRRNIRRRNSADMPAQSVRFDYVYGFEDYDLSMGEGFLEYEIEFAFYNR